MFENRDATEVIHAFHSDAAHNMLSRLPKLAVRLLLRPAPHCAHLTRSAARNRARPRAWRCLT
jgi:hypothetical protein